MLLAKQNIKCGVFVKIPKLRRESTFIYSLWNQHTSSCCGVTCRTTWQWWVQLCPSDNDPCSYYCSAPPAVSGSITYYFSPKRNTLISTHVYSSFRQFSLEEEANSSLGTYVETCLSDAQDNTLNNMHVRFRCLLILCGQPAAVLLGSVRSTSLETTCTQRRRCCFVRKCVTRRVYMSETTFHEWLKIKDGRGCSEEVVAKGKGHARKTGRGRAHCRPIGEQSDPRPVVRNSPDTHGRPLGMAGGWVHLTCLTGIRDWCQGFHYFIFLIIVSGSKVYIFLFCIWRLHAENYLSKI